ncbi:MAG TPA: tetratricopeptide repeat protein [Chloroflexia bacterium]|nr:tetratricopeptide repeat protein [Chloroflexia bacterium]
MDGNDDARFGLWLKERRKSLDLTQEDLADRIGCSPWTITKIETGERRPSKQLAELLSQQLHIPEQEQAEFIRLARLGQPIPPGGPALHNSAAEPAPDVHPASLYTPLTPIIGRDAEVETLRCKLLEEKARLITLTGPPGIGKTRLAVELAGLLQGEFADGAFFVPLASVSDTGLIPTAIAQAVGVREMHEQSGGAALAEALAGRRILLVLDNFEQLVEGGPVITDLMRACPHLHVLVTSREALRVRGEEQFAVRPLALPDRSLYSGQGLTRSSPREQLSSYPAVELFVSRARSVKSDFTLSDENAQTVAAICAHLDGLPLAIELVAARIRLLPAWALLARLGSSLALLTGGPRDVPVRHRTLRAAISWSYDLLTEPEQVFMSRLGVFPDGCDLAAIEAVCNPDGDIDLDILDGLESLIYKSLLHQVDQRVGDEARYTMLQTIREYALERLAERGETDVIMRRMAEYYLHLSETVEPNRGGPNQEQWLNRLEREHDNIRAALGWLISRGDNLALRMVASLWYFWEIRGYLSEGRDWLERTLAHTDASPSSDRAHVLHVSAGLALRQGDYQRCKELSLESLSISRILDDKRGMGRALHALGISEEALGNLEQADAHYSQSLVIWREQGEPANLGRILNSAGVLARIRGDYDRAVELFNESLELHRQTGLKRSIALVLANLGAVALARSEWDQAEALFNESLVLRREIGHKVGIGDCLIGLACVCRARGDALKAARLFASATQLFNTLDYKMEPSDRMVYERGVDETRAALSEPEFDAAWEEGQSMDIEEAVPYALGQVD